MRHERLMIRTLLPLFLLIPFPLAAVEPDRTPRYVIYYNSDASPAESLIGLPYSHIILSFVTLPAESGEDLELSVDPRLVRALDVVGKLQAEGKKVLVSFGGGAMELDAYRPAVGREATLAANLATFVDSHGLDGVDVDFEISRSLYQPLPDDVFDGRAFLVALTRALRQALPAGALITHAPQAPYFDPDWHHGPYLDVLRRAGSEIDWITVQYYNNPDFDLPVETHLVGSGDRPFPASYAGITSGAFGISWPPEKTLVGLPVYHADAGNGYQTPEVVRAQILKPLIDRYGANFGGLAGWQFSTLTADHRDWNQNMAQALHD